MSVPFLTAKPLEEVSAVTHGFFTRAGGQSTGIYASLNCGWGSQDVPESIAHNREAVAKTLGIAPKNLISCHQIHSNSVVTVTEPWTKGAMPKADAMVTDQPNIGLGILTADCTPVLFADTKRRVIGAAHAGWKGAVGGVLEATIAAMGALGASPDTIHAAIGPTIAQPSYEVGTEFHARFLEISKHNKNYFKPSKKPGHWQFNLPAYVKDRLQEAGVNAVTMLNNDTYTNENEFFSYRRTTHRGEADYGRQLSVITLKDE